MQSYLQPAEPLELSAVIDVNGLIVDADEAWQRILGWPGAELLATPLIERVHLDDLEILVTAIHRVYGHGLSVRFSCRYQRKDGTYLLLDCRAVPHTQPLCILLHALLHIVAVQPGPAAL